MTETLPWRHHRINREGILEAFEPGIPLRRRIGAAAVAGVSVMSLALQADVLYSEYGTPNIAPKTILAEGSIPCEGAKAMVLVFSGYGIQNGEITAARITPIAKELNMCTRWVNNGTSVNIQAVADDTVIEARAGDLTTIVPVGESVGGIEAALVANDIAARYEDEFSFPGMLLDSTPGDETSLKWVDRTLAEQVAEHCQLFKLGDVTMTAITLLTDQKDERRLQAWKYWNTVYNATRDASMRLRTGQSCLAGQGFPGLNTGSSTHVYYARTQNPYRDPIVDVDKSEAIIRAKAEGLFDAVYMDGDGITHAAPWDNWQAYEPHYQDVMKKISQKIDETIIDRELATWYRKNPRLPQPK